MTFKYVHVPIEVSAFKEMNEKLKEKGYTWSDFIKKLLLYNNELSALLESPDELTIGDYVTIVTVKTLKDKWLENISQNIPYILESDTIDFLLNTNKKEFCVVIGNGPSLSLVDGKKLAEVVKTTNSLVVCTSATLKWCLKHNIKIDYVTFLDCQDDDYEFVSGVDKNILKNIPAFMEISISPLIVKNYTGRKIFYVSHCPEYLVPNWTHILTKLTNKLSVSTCGNTGGVSYIFGSYLAKNVILIGIDLSWRNEKEFRDYYSDLNKEREFLLIEGYGHKKYIVDNAFLSYKNCMLAWAKEIKEKAGINTYNLTKGGIFYGEHVFTEKDIDNRWNRIFR